MLEQDGAYPEKMCHSSCIFCSCSYTVTSHQLISPCVPKEKPKEETHFLKWWETEMRVSLQRARKTASATEWAANMLYRDRCALGTTGSFPAHISSVWRKGRVWHCTSHLPRMSLETDPSLPCTVTPGTSNNHMNAHGWHAHSASYLLLFR